MPDPSTSSEFSTATTGLVNDFGLMPQSEHYLMIALAYVPLQLMDGEKRRWIRAMVRQGTHRSVLSEERTAGRAIEDWRSQADDLPTPTNRGAGRRPAFINRSIENEID